MSLDSLPPGAAPSTDVVTRKVFINNTVLSDEILLGQLSVNKSFNKVAYAKLVFIDGAVADRNFTLSSDNTFKPGNEIRVQLGYHGNVETVFEGIIIKQAIKIKQDGTSLMTIEAKDKAIKLTGARKSNYFIDKTDSDIITQLAEATALQHDIETTTFLNKQLVQFETTDWDFIVTRAEANSMLVLTDDGKLVIKKPATSTTPVLTATYGQNIFEFDAEMDARRQVENVTGHSWDYTQQQLENSDNGTAVFTETGNLSSDDLGTVMGATVELNHTGHLTQDQLQNWADAYALRNKLSKAVGRVHIQGSAVVKPGTMISLDGVGDRFNGNVFVTGVLHQYNGNWQTDIQFGWREDWFYKKEEVMEKPAAGLLPGINGLQIGLVVDVDDPEGQYRVKVHVPMITSSNEGMWARVSTLDAGAERGVYFRPQVNDEVLLGFLNDDPREPVVLGYLHSQDAKKSPLPEKANNLEYGFVTHEKLKLIFDDTNKKLTISVPGAAGEKTIVINDDSGAIEIKDDNQNSIKMDSSGITIKAGSGNVTIKGTMVMIN
jgi:Rhs element Vgr protein